jgi:alkylation response protein AidB-like acyl-CoA dehydrogenase
MSDLLYGEIENDLRASVRRVLDDKAPWTSVLAGTEKDEPYDAPLWRAVAGELGCAGLPVPEELGGAGATWRETAVVMEELGRSAAPVPFLTSAVIATAALRAAGERELLARLAAGEAVAVLAVPFSAAPGEVPATVRVADGALTGEVTSVADGMAAEVLLVPAGDGLYAVDAADARRTAATSLDMTRRLADLAFSGAPARRVAEGTGAVTAALRTGAAMLASEQLGLAERCLDDTVAYVRTRYQFGRRASSTGSRTCGPRSPRPARSPATPRPASPRTTPTLRSRWPSPRRTARRSPSRPPRSACRCTAASASPGSTRRTST